MISILSKGKSWTHIKSSLPTSALDPALISVLSRPAQPALSENSACSGVKPRAARETHKCCHEEKLKLRQLKEGGFFIFYSFFPPFPKGSSFTHDHHRGQGLAGSTRHTPTVTNRDQCGCKQTASPCAGAWKGSRKRCAASSA